VQRTSSGQLALTSGDFAWVNQVSLLGLYQSVSQARVKDNLRPVIGSNRAYQGALSRIGAISGLFSSPPRGGQGTKKASKPLIYTGFKAFLR